MKHLRRTTLTGWARRRRHLADLSTQVAARLTASPRRLNQELRRAAGPDYPDDLAVPFPLAQAVLGRGLQLAIDAKHLGWQLLNTVSCSLGEANLKHWFVAGGEWKPLVRPFGKTIVYREMRDLVALGDRYRESPLHTAMLDQIAAGTPAVRNDIALETPALVDAYFERYLTLLDSVRQHGLLRMASNRRLQWADLAFGLRNVWQGIREVDIGVAVGANGEIYRLHNAQHRSAIALLLKLPAVPVEVRLVHRTWLRQCLDRHLDLPPVQALVASLAGLGRDKP